MSARRPAVLFSYMGLRNAEGIAEAILRRWDCTLITCEPCTTAFGKKSIPREPLDVATPEEAGPTLQDALARAQRAADLIGASEFRTALDRYHDSAWERLHKAIERVLRRDLFVVMAIADAVERAAEKYDMRLVVVSEDHLRDNRTLVTHARRLGIPTLQVIHSVPTGSMMPLKPVTTDYVAVFSDHTRDQFLRLGANADRTIITGNPAWDRYLRPPLPRHRDAVCHAMNLDPARPIIAYAITASGALSSTFAAYPQHHIDLAEAVLRQFVNVSRAHPDWQFLLRPRPGPQDAEEFESMLAAMPETDRRAITLDRNSPYNATVVSDVVLSTQSNMGIEAMLMGKPAINVDIEALGSAIYREGLGPLFDEHDAILQARSEGETSAMIEAALLDDRVRLELKDRRPYSMRKFNGVCDGRATERVANLILELGGAKRAPHPHYAAQLSAKADAAARNAEGEAAYARGDLQMAVNLFTEALSRDRHNAHVVNNLATAVYACGETKQAWRLILEAFHHDPWHPSVRENLRDLAAATGQDVLAQQLLETFGTVQAYDESIHDHERRRV